MVSTTSLEIIHQALETVSTKQVLAWCKEKLGRSVQSKRREVLAAWARWGRSKLRDEANKASSSSFELRHFDQIARRIVEHHPPRIGVFFDPPRQIDMTGAELCHNGSEILNGKGDDREASRNWIEWRDRSAFEDDQIDTAEIEMRALLIVHQQPQADHITIEMRGGSDIFGPQTNNGKFG